MDNPPFEAGYLQRTFRQDHLYLVLYLDQEYAGERQNQSTVVTPRHGKKFGGKGFGDTVVNDWPIYDGPDLSKASMVARAQGHHIQTGKDESGKWFLSCCIVFLDDSCYPGSTLAVTGMIEQASNKGEWAIVGGTGKFNLARGAVYYDVVGKNESTSVIKELHIGVIYTPIERSTVTSMFSEFNPWEVDDAIDNGMQLGRGGYGSVYKAKIRNIVFAVKNNNYGSSQGVREFKQEVEILRRVQHKNLIRLVGACSTRLVLVYEFLPNGTLEDRLRQKSFSWQGRLLVLSSICSALEFLHNAKPNPIAHGDLKPSNILFDARDVCKLGDFGISRVLKYKSDTTTPGHTTTTWTGTKYYLDPEFIRSSRLTPQSDVHALGIIMLQLVTGRGPEGLRTHVEENLSEDLVDATLDLDDRSKLDAVEMMRLGLKCSHDERKERPDLATQVRPVIESMRRGACQDSG